MASKIPMQVYEDTTPTYTADHLYEPIKIDKKENNLNLSRKQWFNIFLLMLAGSLVSFGLGSTVTYFTIHSVMDLQVTNLDRGKDDVSNISISQTLKTIVRERDLVIDSKMSALEERINEQFKAHKLISENLKEVVSNHSKGVGFTARGGRIISGNLIEFNQIRTSYGPSIHSVYTGGIYHVTYPGYYIITINILATKEAFFYIRKNDADIVSAMVHYGGSDTGHHMASASAFVQLASGDTVTIKGSRVDQVSVTSSMTIVRI